MCTFIDKNQNAKTVLLFKRNLQLFLAHARDVVLKSANNADDETKDDSDGRNMRIASRMSRAARVATAIRKVR